MKIGFFLSFFFLRIDARESIHANRPDSRCESKGPSKSKTPFKLDRVTFPLLRKDGRTPLSSSSYAMCDEALFVCALTICGLQLCGFKVAGIMSRDTSEEPQSLGRLSQRAWTVLQMAARVILCDCRF